MSIGASDCDLGKHREVDAEVGRAELRDFLVGSRLLAREVIGRKAEHDKAALTIVAIKLLKSLILGRQPALRGNVDHQQNLAAIISKCRRFAADRGKRNGLDRCVHGKILFD